MIVVKWDFRLDYIYVGFFFFGWVEGVLLIMDDLLKKRMGALRDVLVNKKSICKNFDRIQPVIDELHQITMDSELSARMCGERLVDIIMMIIKELREQKEEGDESSQILLDAFGSLSSYLNQILQRCVHACVCVCVCFDVFDFFVLGGIWIWG